MGWTPLHCCCEKEFESVARLLLERGADMSVRTADNETPLDLVPEHKKDMFTKLFKEFASENS